MKIKDKMIFLKLSPKKEYIKILGIDFTIFTLGFLGSYLMKSWLYIGISLGLVTIVTFYFFSRYNTKISDIKKNNLDDFINIFSFFRIYLHNGFNVYTALKEISVFANENLKQNLDVLINDIDQDKSVRPFMKFAHCFDEIIIEEIMLSIYQIIDDGEQSNYLNQFELIFDKLSDLVADKNLKAKDSSLGALSSAPLIGSCFLIITITIGIIGVVGDLINVI